MWHWWSRLRGRQGMNKIFTMIMAGSALLWVRTCRELSSDALNHQCLFRLQLTLLTALSCPANKETFVIYLELFWVNTILLLWCSSVNQAERSTEEALNDRWVTFAVCGLISPAPLWRLYSYRASSVKSKSCSKQKHWREEHNLYI